MCKKLVLAAETNSLRGGRGVKMEFRADPGVLPRAPDRVLDGVEDAGGKEEGRLPHSLARVHGAGVRDAAKKAHVELGRDVIETGDFVCSRTFLL